MKTVSDKMWDIASKLDGETKASMAAKLGIKSQSLYKWYDDKNRTNPRPIYIKRFCAEYKVTQDELLTGQKNCGEKKPTLSRMEKQLLQSFRLLNTEEQEEILDKVVDLSFKL